MLKFRTFLLFPMIPLLALALAVMPISCSDDENNREVWTDVSRTNTFSGSTDQVFLVDTTGNVNLTYTLELGSSSMDVYFIFTNTTMSDAGSNPVVKSMGDDKESLSSISSNIYNDMLIDIANSDSDQVNSPTMGTTFVSDFNKNSFSMSILDESNTLSKSYLQVSSPMLAYNVDQEIDLYLYNEQTQATNTIKATCKAKVADIHSRTLYIWVKSDEFGLLKVTQTMVDTIADKFLKTGSDNDIYEWISTVFGVEWGTHSYSELISSDNTIHILIAEIVDSSGFKDRILGYFWNKDNFQNNFTYNGKYYYTNKKVMFYLNSYFVKTDMNNILSTLAHEFQHMINFYQKIIYTYPNGDATETWLNEMCSLVAEDLVSSKLGVNGPRGVTYNDSTAGSSGNNSGRLPLYNYYNDESVVNWYSSYPQVLRNYSINYAFGAYLARNFKGAEFFQKLVQNSHVDYQAINYALNAVGYLTEDFSSMLRKWGAANILSHQPTPPDEGYRYNISNWFTSTIGGLNYQLGSIDLYYFTYYPQTGYPYYDSKGSSALYEPYVYTSIPPGTQDKASNIYYYVGKHTGTITRSITMEDNIKLTVVVK